MPELARLCWEEARDALARARLALLPVGSCEQHGPHMTLDTDLAIAEALARRLANDLGEVALLCPSVGYGLSEHHLGFPGTLTLRPETFIGLTSDIVESLARWGLRRVLVVNGHGGNVDALTTAVHVLREEGTDASWQPCRHGDAHAGRGETSLLLHLAPHRVAMDRAEPGNVEPVGDLLPRLREHGLRPLAPNGVLGDPRGASAAEGATLLDRMADELAAALREPAQRHP